MNEVFEQAVQVMLGDLETKKYKKNTIEFYKSRCKAIRKHLEETHQEFELEHLRQWADKYCFGLSQSMRCSFTHVLFILNNIMNGKSLYSRVPVFPPKKVLQPKTEDYRGLVQYYEEHLGIMHFAPATVRFCSYSSILFLCFLENRGNISVSKLSRGMVLSFISEGLEGMNPSTKRAIAYRIRKFLSYLFDQKLVSEDFSIMVPTECPKQTKIISVLTEEQQKAVIEDKPVKTEREARERAIGMLALRLLLRSSDILHLRLGDIDWRTRVIRIIQQKTKVPLTLPIPDDVGNALLEYILDFRPKVKFEEVFLSVRNPRCPLKAMGHCAAYLVRYCEIGYGKRVNGLHVYRRTGASNLLATNVSVDTISDILGHQGNGTVDQYLSTDDNKMTLCAMDLSLVGIPEVLR